LSSSRDVAGSWEACPAALLYLTVFPTHKPPGSVVSSSGSSRDVAGSSYYVRPGGLLTLFRVGFSSQPPGCLVGSLGSSRDGGGSELLGTSCSATAGSTPLLLLLGRASCLAFSSPRLFFFLIPSASQEPAREPAYRVRDPTRDSAYRVRDPVRGPARDPAYCVRCPA
jgi:hypothetical protein